LNDTVNYLNAIASFHNGNKHAQFVLDHAREALSGPLASSNRDKRRETSAPHDAKRAISRACAECVA
jgi:hypothetical protein